MNLLQPKLIIYENIRKATHAAHIIINITPSGSCVFVSKFKGLTSTVTQIKFRMPNVFQIDLTLTKQFQR